MKIDFHFEAPTEFTLQRKCHNISEKTVRIRANQ